MSDAPATATPETAEGDKPTPNAGTLLQQLFGASELSGNVQRVLGLFNPKAVTMDQRFLMRCYPDVAFASALVRAPIITLDWSIESKDPIIAAFVEQALRPRYRELAKAASQALLLGFQVIEPEWQAGPVTIEREDKVEGTVDRKTLPVGWTFKRFKAIDPRSLTFVMDPDRDDVAGVRQMSYGMSKAGPGYASADHIIRWSFRDEDVFGDPRGFGIYDQAFVPWYDQAATDLFANRYFEKRADPTPVARADAEALKDEKGLPVDGYSFMARQLQAGRAGGFIILPALRDKNGEYIFNVDLLEDSKRGDMYQERVDKKGIQILRAHLLLEEAVSSTEMGGRARSEEHGTRLDEIHQSHTDEFVDEVLQPQVVDRLVLHNFGRKALEESKTRVKAAGISGALREAFTTVLGKLLDGEATLEAGGRIQMRDRIDGVGILQALRIPLRPADEAQEEADARKVAADERREQELEITKESEAAAEEELRRGGALAGKRGE